MVERFTINGINGPIEVSKITHNEIMRARKDSNYLNVLAERIEECRRNGFDLKVPGKRSIDVPRYIQDSFHDSGIACSSQIVREIDPSEYICIVYAYAMNDLLENEQERKRLNQIKRQENLGSFFMGLRKLLGRRRETVDRPQLTSGNQQPEVTGLESIRQYQTQLIESMLSGRNLSSNNYYALRQSLENDILDHEGKTGFPLEGKALRDFLKRKEPGLNFSITKSPGRRR